MPSINKALQTFNAELQTRVDAWVRARDGMKNLLNSTDITAAKNTEATLRVQATRD